MKRCVANGPCDCQKNTPCRKTMSHPNQQKILPKLAIDTFLGNDASWVSFISERDISLFFYGRRNGRDSGRFGRTNYTPARCFHARSESLFWVSFAVVDPYSIVFLVIRFREACLRDKIILCHDFLGARRMQSRIAGTAQILDKS